MIEVAQRCDHHKNKIGGIQNACSLVIAARRPAFNVFDLGHHILGKTDMTIEPPKFPTPEDERRASLLWQAVRESVDIENDIPAIDAPNMKKPAEAGS